MSLDAYFHAQAKKEQQPVCVAIIGTSGRTNDTRNAGLTAAIFDQMIQEALACLQRWGLEPAQTHLISGGAAWSDHVAVALFLRKQVAGLTLHLPCLFAEASFTDTGSSDWRTNPGRTANYYHALFSKKLGRDTLAEIAAARQQGAVLDTSLNGFYARNSSIAAKATHMLAFSWSDSGAPTDGGTADTWKKCRLPAARKAHISLLDLCQNKESL